MCSYSLSKLGQNPGSATPVYLHVLEMPHTLSLSSDPSVQSASDNIKIHIYTSVAEPPLFGLLWLRKSEVPEPTPVPTKWVGSGSRQKKVAPGGSGSIQ